EPSHFLLEPRTRDRVERAEWLVHQQHRGVGSEGSRQTHSLALAARELSGVALAVARLEADELQQLRDARADARLLPAEEPRHGRDVVADRHVREEAHLLDHVPDPSPQFDDGQLPHAPPVDANVTVVERDETVDHLQRGRLAAARGPDEDAERSAGNLERELVQRLLLATGVPLRDAVEDDLAGGTHAVRFRIPASPIRPPAAISPAVIA